MFPHLELRPITLGAKNRKYVMEIGAQGAIVRYLLQTCLKLARYAAICSEGPADRAYAGGNAAGL